MLDREEGVVQLCIKEGTLLIMVDNYVSRGGIWVMAASSRGFEGKPKWKGGDYTWKKKSKGDGFVGVVSGERV